MKKQLKPRSTKGYGWIPDLPDHRDLLFAALPKPRLKLPKSVDLRGTCSPVEDQGQLGSCTANALAGALEFLERKDAVSFQDLSRLFIYYNERSVEGTVGTDSGAMIRDGIKTLAQLGVCPESQWPYAIARFAAKPTPACYSAAAKHQITTYSRIETLDDMRTCLAAGFPFVFGFTVYGSFESQAVANSGIVPLPKPGESTLGGHAVMACGYDDGKKRFLARNSWGPDWGLSGYFWMPYAYLTNRQLSDDLWTIRRANAL
jgi:C1A family cysteine protease